MYEPMLPDEVTSMKNTVLQQLDKDLGSALSDILVAGGFDGKQVRCLVHRMRVADMSGCRVNSVGSLAALVVEYRPWQHLRSLSNVDSDAVGTCFGIAGQPV